MTMEGLDPKKIPDIIADRKRYEGILYSPLPEAHKELMRRRQDAGLEKKISDLLGGNIPEPLQENPRAVLCRSVMSPNYEARHFTRLVEEFGRIAPLYMEYRGDKFASSNDSKLLLGKLHFFGGRGRRGGMKVDPFRIIDLPATDGKPLSSLRTVWGEGFVEFHHRFFDTCYRKASSSFFDSTAWLQSFGKTAETYYKSLLLLFVRHAILFENVLLNKQEIGFTTRVFLPAFLSIHQQLGLKPLIVPLEPTQTADNRFWLCYPGTDKAYVEQRMRRTA